jgi:hypothetical protein
VTEAYEVDIPPGVYESGGGYSWTVHTDATIEASDVVISKIPDAVFQHIFGEDSDFEMYKGMKGEGKKEFDTGLKEAFVCCPSHAAELFPAMVDGLLEQDYIDADIACKANLLTDEQAYEVSLAMKEAVLSGEDELEASALRMSQLVVACTPALGVKESTALKTVNQKISALPREQANFVRANARALRDAMNPRTRIHALMEIPDSVWDDAVAADELEMTEQ